MPSRMSLDQTIDDGPTHGLSQAWNDLSIALVDELHAIVSDSLQGVADAAKHELEQIRESAPPASVNGESTGSGWSPWLGGATIGIGVTLLTRWR